MIDLSKFQEIGALTLEKKEADNQELLYYAGIEFVRCKGGLITYVPCGQKKPVTVDLSPFAISKYPITYKQFNSFLDDHPDYEEYHCKDSLFLRDYRDLSTKQMKRLEDCAVYFIGWEDAVNYCNYISENARLPMAYVHYNRTGEKGIRLPSESEWYYAATCGLGNAYEIPTNIVCRDNRIGAMGKTAHNNDLYVNELGIAGMLGNINEWTDTESQTIRIKKFENKDSIQSGRMVIKGGSFASARGLVTPTYATDVSKDNLHYIGFRVAITI